MKSTLVIALALISSICFAQSTQQGKVLCYQGADPKTPLSNVSIAATNAPAVISDAEGAFTLSFRTLHPGDAIQFRRVELNGYEVMNTEALDVARITRKDSNHDLTIILAKRETLQKLRAGYKSVASQRYEKQFKATEEQLEQMRKEGKLAEEQFNARMDSLEADYEDKLSKLETYIDKFARIDLSDLDADEQKIIALVQAGDFEGALKIYESQNLPERLKKSRADRDELASAQSKIAAAAQQAANDNLRLRAAIDRQVTLLRMAGDDANLQKAHQILYQAFLADTTDWQARKEYGGSLAEHGQYAEQLQLMRNGIAIEKDTVARGLLMVDAIHALWVMEHFQDAVQLAFSCDSLMTAVHTPNYKISSRIVPACALYQLRYYVGCGPLESGLQIADRIRESWAADTLSRQSLQTHIDLLTTMTEIYTQSGRHTDALWSTRECISLSQVVERRFPWNSILDGAYANACVTFMMEGQRVEALEAARQSNAIMMAKLEKSNKKFAVYQATINYFSVVEALVNANEYALADTLLQSVEKYKVFERFEQMFPEKKDVFGLFGLFKSRIYLNTNHITEGKILAEKAIEILKTDEYGSTYIPYLGNDILARVALAEQRYSESIQWCQQSIDYCKAAYDESQDAWDADNLCRQYLLLAEIQLAANNRSKAKAAVKMAEKVASFESDKLYIEQIKKTINLK